MENQNINEIYQSAMNEIEASTTSERLQELKIKFLAKKSVLMLLIATLGTMPPEQRREMGQKLNEVKAKIAEAIEIKENQLRQEELAKKLKSETIDISLLGKRGLRSVFQAPR